MLIHVSNTTKKGRVEYVLLLGLVYHRLWQRCKIVLLYRGVETIVRQDIRKLAIQWHDSHTCCSAPTHRVASHCQKLSVVG